MIIEKNIIIIISFSTEIGVGPGWGAGLARAVAYRACAVEGWSLCWSEGLSGCGLLEAVGAGSGLL